MSKSIIIIGAGGHSTVLVDAITLLGRKIIGATDIKKVSKNFPVDVLGDDAFIEKYSPLKIELVNAVGYLPRTSIRKEIFHRYKLKGYTFMTVVHPSAVVSPSVKISEGVQVMAGAIIQPGAIIGSNSIVNTKVSVDHGSAIGKNCHIAPGAVLCGNVVVGDNSFVGANCTILQNIQIAKHSIIPAGSIIRNNIIIEALSV